MGTDIQILINSSSIMSGIFFGLSVPRLLLGKISIKEIQSLSIAIFLAYISTQIGKAAKSMSLRDVDFPQYPDTIGIVLSIAVFLIIACIVIALRKSSDDN